MVEKDKNAQKLSDMISRKEKSNERHHQGNEGKTKHP